MRLSRATFRHRGDAIDSAPCTPLSSSTGYYNNKCAIYAQDQTNRRTTRSSPRSPLEPTQDPDKDRDGLCALCPVPLGGLALGVPRADEVRLVQVCEGPERVGEGAGGRWEREEGREGGEGGGARGGGGVGAEEGGVQREEGGACGGPRGQSTGVTSGREETRRETHAGPGWSRGWPSGS